MNGNNLNMMENNIPITNTHTSNILNILNEISRKYNLTKEEYNDIYTKFQNSTKPESSLKLEIDDLGNFYYHQHKIKETIIKP